MQAIIPAAGRGSRLGSLTDDRPKAVVNVAGKPLLSHVFDSLLPHTDEFIVIVGYLGSRIKDRFGDQYNNTPITYVEQSELLGLADAVQQTEPVVESSFLQLNGDNVLSGNVTEVVETHRQRDSDATLLVERVSRERAKRGGVVVVGEGEQLQFVEKPDDPPSQLATTGCFAFSRRIFAAIEAIEPSDRGEYELPDAIEWLAHNGGTIELVCLDGRRVNVNTPADLWRAEGVLSDTDAS